MSKFLNSQRLSKLGITLLWFSIIAFIILRPLPLIRLISAWNQGQVIYTIDTDQKLIALTIDDGPHADITPLILDVLKKHQAKATFFLITNNIKKNEDVIQRLVDEGHEIGNHMLDDNRSVYLSESEFNQQIQEADKALKQYQPEIAWYRPGAGLYNQRVLDSASQLGYRTVLGSIYPYDASISEQSGGKGFIEYFIKSNSHPGGIIILHDGRIRTVHVLDEVIPYLKADGYTFVTLSDLENLEDK